MVSSSQDATASATQASEVDLRHGFQAVGLRPYEAQVLLALLRVGTANSASLARLSGVPRTSIYQVMEGLTAQGLAERLPSHGSTTWLCRGWEPVLDRIDQIRDEEHRRHRAHTAELRASLARHLPAEPTQG